MEPTEVPTGLGDFFVWIPLDAEPNPAAILNYVRLVEQDEGSWTLKANAIVGLDILVAVGESDVRDWRDIDWSTLAAAYTLVQEAELIVVRPTQRWKMIQYIVIDREDVTISTVYRIIVGRRKVFRHGEFLVAPIQSATSPGFLTEIAPDDFELTSDILAATHGFIAEDDEWIITPIEELDNSVLLVFLGNQTFYAKTR